VLEGLSMTIVAGERFRLDKMVEFLDSIYPPIAVEDKVKYIKSRISVFPNTISDPDLNEYLKIKGLVEERGT
jgi:hypothetical protein